MEILEVQRRLRDCGDDMSPCGFYNAGVPFHRDPSDGYSECGWCDNRRARGFKFCPRDKTKCYKDMLNDIFDAVDAVCVR